MNFSFWKLVYCLTRHGNTPEEIERAQEVHDWAIANMTPIKFCLVDPEAVIMGALYDFILDTDKKTLPDYALIKDNIAEEEQSEVPMEALKEYESIPTGEFHAYWPAELDAVLDEYRKDFDTKRFTAVCQRAILINEASIAGDKKQKLKGTKDAWDFVVDKREGFFPGEIVAPKLDLKYLDIELRYQGILGEKLIESGIPEISLFEGDMVGILGYLGHRKSTICRFIGYNAFLQGSNVLLLTIENDVQTESDLSVIMHAQNRDIFGTQFSSLSYKRFKRGQLTKQELGGMIAAQEDFKQYTGNYIIRKPLANWQSCRQVIEAVNRKTPLSLVIIDYIQLLEPVAKNFQDMRTQMTAMIKDIRQFSLTFDNGLGHKLAILSPIQGNEAGKAYAEDHQGIWSDSGINNDKELARSMTAIYGIFPIGVQNGDVGTETILTISNPKSRFTGQVDPFRVRITGSGHVSFLSGSVPKNNEPQRQSPQPRDNYEEILF